MDEDFGEKSQEATPHRRQQAREEGQVVKSQDLASAALLERCLERRPIRFTHPWRMAALLWLLQWGRRLMFWRP